jgi:hypothetical protein
MSRSLQEYETSTPNKVVTSISTPSPVTRRYWTLLYFYVSFCLTVYLLLLIPTSICSSKRMLELEGIIEPVACPALSPVAATEKGKAKKLKVVRSKKK